MGKVFSAPLFVISLVFIGLAVWSVQGMDPRYDTGGLGSMIFVVIFGGAGTWLFEKARELWNK